MRRNCLPLAFASTLALMLAPGAASLANAQELGGPPSTEGSPATTATPSQMADFDPAAATAPARCKDGTIPAATTRHACMGHGGLDAIVPLSDPPPRQPPVRR